MKRGVLFFLLCMLLQGMQILICQECDQKISSGKASPLHVSKSMLCDLQECVLHECQEDEVEDLSWFEWMQKVSENIFLHMQIVVYKIGLYVFRYNVYESISLVQEKLAENYAELGNIQKALWYSQESLHSSVYALSYCAHAIETMQKSQDTKFEMISSLRDHIVRYTQHVQSHIITMTDFASDEKDSDSWKTYESTLMSYFEKMQQVMQNIDLCEDLMCKHDAQYCSTAHHEYFEQLLGSDFDPDAYD